MELSIKKKEKVIHKIHKIADQALSIVVASIEGVTVNEITQLRKEARSLSVVVHVVRNTLMRRMIAPVFFLCLRNIFIGPSIIAFSLKDPSDAAKIFERFANDCECFKIKGAAFEGKFIDASQINFLSSLPDYKGAIIKIISIMKISSIGNLIRVLYSISEQKN